MAVHSSAANLLLSAELGETSPIEDSDDCSSDEEVPEDAVILNQLKPKQEELRHLYINNLVEEESEDDIHKMNEIEDRNYQIELLEMAKKANIIVCLPTGSGKTFIALKLTEYLLPSAIQNKQKIVFCANNVPLVNQQAAYFSSNLSNTATSDDKHVRAVTGDLNVDIWKQEQWNEVLNSCDILVMSTQIVLDAITKAYVKWSEIKLLILDECHHAQKNHPMAELMKLYCEQKAKGNKNIPKVLGLTATIIAGKSKVENIPKEIKDIEELLCCRAVTHWDYENVLRNSTDTLVEIRRYDVNYKENDPVCGYLTSLISLLEVLPKTAISDDEISPLSVINHPSLFSEDQIFQKNKSPIKSIKQSMTDLRKTYVELGPYCCKVATIIKMIDTLQAINELEMSEGSGDDSSSPSESGDGEIREENGPIGVVNLLYQVFTTLTQFLQGLEEEMQRSVMGAGIDMTSPKAEAHMVMNCVSDKVKLLLRIVKSRKPNATTNPEDVLCGIVFCQRRITAYVLRWYLAKAVEHCPEEFDFVKPDVVVGHSTVVTNTDEARFTAKRQMTVIRKFHKKELNLLLATRVVEEGLDVPSCNLVVRFDTIQTYPSFVQALGRARKSGAKCFVMIDSAEEGVETKKIKSFIEFNRALSDALKKNALHVGENKNDKVAEFVVPIEPFRPGDDPNGPAITHIEAISLVHRYCSGLSCDRLGALVPISWWTQEKNGHISLGFKAYVQLPTLSPVKEVVEGQLMPDKTLAKRSAHLEACKKLYEAGEFTDNLLPKPRSIDDYKCQFLDDLQVEYKEEKERASKKVGSRVRVQWYSKKKPEALEASRVVANAAVFVYRIVIKLQQFRGDERAQGLYNFKKHLQCYGIVTSANLENLPNFVLLANYGSFSVKVKRANMHGGHKVELSQSEVNSLESFQVYLRDSIYNSKCAILKADSQKTIFVAPLAKRESGDYDINWELVNNLLRVDESQLVEPPSDRKEMRFTPASYENAVLIPWYKDDKSTLEYQCTLKILEEETAHSKFDDTRKFPTYAAYFGGKYGLELNHPEFPLILVKDVGKQLNFLTKKVDAKILRKDMQHSLIKMVPELTHIHPMPASMFVQGRLLPSILHRIYRLLLANQLRQSVASYFHWDVESIRSIVDQHEVLDINSTLENTCISDEDDDDEGPESLKFENLNLNDEVEEEPQEEKFVLLESINPFNVRWEDISECMESRKPKHIRDSKYAMPEPPTKKSAIELVSIDDVKFESFDAETDFEQEKGPSAHLLMESLTLSNAQDFISLEKWEVMGDSVLKLIVSLHLFNSFPTWDEGKMTLLRMRLISNLHLYQLAQRKDIGELLSGSIFIPDKNWLPCGFVVPENVEEFVKTKEFALGYETFNLIPTSNIETMSVTEIEDLMNARVAPEKNPVFTTYTHSRIGDKSLADSMEAIMGAYYMNGGIDGAFRIMDWLGLRGPMIDGSNKKYSRATILTPLIRDRPKGQQLFIPFLSDLEETIQYKFKDPWLAVEALTHPTFVKNRHTAPYERLEYVGDAVLDFLITDYIVKHTNIEDPGQITDLRSALVNNVTFGSLAVRYGFHKCLLHLSKTLGDYISQFAAYQEENNHKVSNPFKLFNDFDCPTVKEIEVPKVLGDIFESIAGAVFVDSGMSIDTVWKVFYRLMKRELEKFSKKIPKAPVRELYETFPGGGVKFIKISNSNNQKNKKVNSMSRYQLVVLTVPVKDKTCAVVGVGSNVKEAKQAAAKYIMRKIHDEGLAGLAASCKSKSA